MESIEEIHYTQTRDQNSIQRACLAFFFVRLVLLYNSQLECQIFAMLYTVLEIELNAVRL